MKCTKVEEYIKRTACPRSTSILHGELEQFLRNGPGPQARILCDRIIRACNHQLGVGQPESHHVDLLAKLVELALNGYDASVDLVSHSSPLYMEKILFHIVKKLGSLGLHRPFSHVGGLLYSRLATASQAIDYSVLVRSCFAVLWSGLSPPRDGSAPTPKEKLQRQLQALSFLLLSDRDAASPVSKAPAYAEDALAEFQRGCGTLAETEASFLLRETCAHVHGVCAAAEEEEEAGGGDGGSPGAACLPALSEVVLVAVKHLSKAGHWTAAYDLIDRAAPRLGGPLAPVLVLGRRAVEVHRAGEGCGEALRACARALRSLPGDQEERVVHAALEGCGLVAWAVEAGQSGAMSGATLLAWFSFLEEQQELIQKALQRGSNSESEGSRLQQALCLSMYQGFVAAYESLLASQLESSETLDRVLLYCQATAGRMLTELRSLPTNNILLKAVPAVSNLVCGLYNRRLYDQAFTLAEILCQELRTNPPASLTVDRVSRAFMLAVQSSRRGGQLDRALDWVVLWLRALGDGLAAHLAEPVSLWAKVKADAARAGLEDARLRTLRDGLGAEAPGEAVLLLLLEEELRAYREAGGDTYQERFNTLCDLLDLCPEGGGEPHRRALYLWEMAQVVCFQDFSEQTDCSAVDFTHEALRLLESEPETAENADRLRDDRAHVLLWQYICTLERSLQEATDRERRLQELREQSAEAAQQPLGTNDLDYEDKQRQQSGHAVYEGLDFNLAVESQRFLPLDRALGEWAALLRAGELPAVRNARQTVSSLALVAALYRLMGKPLQALEAYKLATGLSRCLGDAQSGAASLCHSAQLLLELGAPDLAQAQLDLAEELLASESQPEGPTALSVLAVLLRAQHCYSIGQVERGVPFLCRALQETAEPRPSKSWYLLQARVLQTSAAYLGLDTGSLPEELRRRVTLHGLKSADTALYKSLKLLCSLLVTLVGGGLYGGHGGSSSSAQTRFIDQGDNLVLKWQVLSEVLGCSVKVVGARSGSGAVHEAKLQCLEALRLATKLQALSRCAELLVVKAELELMKGETEECGFDLEKVRNLLELCTDFSNPEQKAEVKIKLRKGRAAPKAEPSDPRPEEEPRDFLNTRWFPKEAIERDQASSPPLKARPRLWLSSLGHGQGCQCPCCSEPGLGRVTARWAAAQAHLASQLGPAEAGSSRKLHLAALGRCKSVAAAFAAKLAKLSLACPAKGFSKPGLLQDVTGRSYLRMALSGLDARTDKAQGTWKVLEAGLAFLASKPELQPLKAGLLTAKALASWLALAALRDCPPEELFSTVWTWNPPKGSAAPGPSPRTPAAPNPEPAGAATAEKKEAKKPKEPLPKIKLPGCAVKAKRLAPKTPVASRRPRDTPLGGGAFDFDTQVPTVACTPVHRASGPPSAARSAARGLPPKLQFQVYQETSPAQDEARPVPAAPKRTKKPRFKVEFSDESDSESNPPAGPPEKTNAPKKRAATTRTARAPKTPAEKAPAPRPTRAKRSTVLPRSSTSSEEEAAATGGPAGRGRARRQPAAEARSWEEPEQMRTIDEEAAWALDTSVEQLRASDAETDDRRAASNNDCEVLRRDLGGEVDRLRLSETRPGPGGGGGPPGAALPAHLSHPGPDGLSEEALRSLLRSAWLTLQHCPLPALYPRLCGLLALTLGQSQPVTTAMLHAQSLGVTSRHQMIRHLDNRLKKLKKGSGELAERLGALSLEGGEEAGGALERRLARLEGVFSFPTADPQAFPQHHCQHFTQQVQQLPSGLTVCVLSVLGVQHGGVGDTVLLTRLERDSAPVTVHVPTARRKHPVSWLVQEMDSVIKQQKVVSCVSEKARWWEGRRGLDARVERLLEEMEWMLGCWRGLLLPAAAHRGLSEHAARLRKTMGTWGLEISEEMLKALLSASLSHEDLRRFAAGACPGRSQECVELLQAAASQLADGAEPAGHLVLVLDKHLQKLPWESISCLRRRSVTRMPSVQAVLSHCLLKESDPEGVLNRGVSAKRVFYVLDPDANLGDTRDRFKDWFSSKEDWHGVCGVAPDSTRLQEAVASKDLYIYVGHGAGARFLDGQKVLKQEMRAASLLFGCSSAALAVRGELEGAGIILHYLMAGCPLVLGNLWDVTDRDIDRFTKALLESWLSADPGAALLDHMASSRQATHLKHLIGAAPVVYGLPIHLQ